MKRISILIAMLLAFGVNAIHAQSVLPNNTPGIVGTYTMKVKVYVHNHNDACGGCGNNHWYVELKNQDNTTNRIYDECFGENYNYSNSRTIIVPANNPVRSLFTFADRDRDGFLGGCRGIDPASGSLSFQYYSGSGCDYFNGEFIPGEGYVIQNSTKEVTVTPNLKYLDSLNGQISDLPTYTRITYKAPSGFPAEVYHWQYALNDGVSLNWTDFPPALMGDSIVRFNATDLLGSMADSNVFKAISIRIKACGPASTDNQTISDTTTLSIYKDAPHITATITQQTSCFDALDGSASIHFDRDLIADETLFIIVNRLDTVTNTSTTAYTSAGLTAMPGNSYQVPSILSPGKYVVKLIGTLIANGQTGATFTEDPQGHYDTFYISKPPAVAFSKTKVDVWCYNGTDGQIDVMATGGVGGFQYRLFAPLNNDTTWYAFNSGTQEHVTALPQGIYFIKVKDANGCVAKNNGGIGAEITDTTIINQPADSIHIDLVERMEPTAFGFSNGYIHVAVYGGTISPSGTYSYIWSDSSNIIQATDSAYTVAGVYHIWLKNIGAGIYSLNIRDHQYANASSKDGCEQNTSYIMLQPEPLRLQLAVTKLPSCNRNNTYLDPYSDGIITAHALGGTTFPSTSLPYQYVWKKKGANNNWVIMPGYTDSIAEGLDEGWYAVNITDAQGIQIGIYQNNTLIQLTDSSIYVAQHPLLTINEVISPVGCNASVTGGIVSNVMGGLPPYSYNWSNGDTGMDISDIASGGYFLYVTDTNGCRVSKAMNVPEPDGFTLTLDTIPPTCHDGCDGSITLHLTGGTLPYSYAWQQSSSNANQVTGLCSGGYSVTISDANNCSFQRAVTLSNPPLITVNMPRDTTLCNGQETMLDITINDPAAVYSWLADNGFTANTAKVTLTDAGNYFAKITNGKGCIGTDTFTLKRLQLNIDAEILLPTHAIVGEEIILVNISNPRAHIVEWKLPAQASLLESTENYIRFKVNDTGTYAVTLLTGVDACREKMTKDVIVTAASDLPGVNNNLPPFIQDLKVLPNPNDGHFTVILTLREVADANLKIINVLSSTVAAERRVSGQKVYQEVFDISAMAAGTYLLSAETKQERRTIKIIVE